MVACCSPSSKYSEETLSTLRESLALPRFTSFVVLLGSSGRVSHLSLSLLTIEPFDSDYASRAKNIKNIPIVQLDPQQRVIMALRQEIDALRAENCMLRSGQGLPPPPPRIMASPTHGDVRGSLKLLASSSDGPPHGAVGRESSAVGRESSAVCIGRVNSTSSFVSPRADPSHPPFEKAVGYAAGYAAGLDQVAPPPFFP